LGKPLDEFINEIAKEINGDKEKKNTRKRDKAESHKKTLLDYLGASTPRRKKQPKREGKRQATSEPKLPAQESSRSVSKEETSRAMERSSRTPTSGILNWKTEIPVVESSPSRASPGRARSELVGLDSGPASFSSWFLGEKMDVARQISGYLLDVRYDGKAKKAYLVIYDPETGRLQRWYDRSGHKPYFLVDAEPGPELRSAIARDGRDDLVVRFELVRKFHPIERRNVKLAKIVVDDPLAVRSLRDVLRRREYRVYEADIKYHHNYVYDKKLIPGLRVAASSDVKVELYEPPREAVERVLKAFDGEPEEVKERAVRWIPLFEQEPPMPSMVAVDIEVYTPFEGELPDPESAPYPVVSIALVSSDGRRRVLLLNRDDVGPGDLSLVEGEVEVFDDERALILEAMREIDRHSIVITFNGDNFDLPYLYNRLVNLGIPPGLVPMEFHQSHVAFRNQLHIDLYKFFDIRALQVYAFGNKYREKNLDSIAEALLGKRKVQLDKPISELDLATLAHYNLNDAALTLELVQYGNNLVWNLIILLMRISKLGLEDVTRSQVSAWIKSLLNWEHRNRGWLIPGKEAIEEVGGEARSSAIIKDKKYKGAIVLKPPRGVFFNIIVLDFASLYPSVIKNWNLSYETVNNPRCRGEKRRVPEVGHEVCMSIKGLTSEIVGLLRDFRVKIYKKKAKDKSLPETARLWFNTVQAAMKVYINASYGVFGNQAFSYYSLAVAESVTAIGRAVLKDTLREAERLGLMILYGDTDSIFIWDPPREKLDEIIEYVRERHSLDLEVDKVFRLVLFSGLKKNYIGVTPDGNVVIKGMVGKKSNTPEFLKKEFAEATRIIASIDSPEHLLDAIERLREHIEGILRKLRNKEYMLDELAIKVMLSKDPKEYTKNTPQHVKAALMLRKHGVRVTRGTVVTYVKTRDRLGVRPVRLARLPDVDTSKYTDLVKTVFEQMLMSMGLSWNSLLGHRNLLFASSTHR